MGSGCPGPDIFGWGAWEWGSDNSLKKKFLLIFVRWRSVVELLAKVQPRGISAFGWKCMSATSGKTSHYHPSPSTYSTISGPQDHKDYWMRHRWITPRLLQQHLVWSSAGNLKKLQTDQNALARVVSEKRKYIYVYHFMPCRMTPSVRHRAIKVHYYYYY